MKVPEIQVVDLARERCEDCRPGTPTLAPDVARELAAGLHPDWVLSEAWIERSLSRKPMRLSRNEALVRNSLGGRGRGVEAVNCGSGVLTFQKCSPD